MSGCKKWQISGMEGILGRFAKWIFQMPDVLLNAKLMFSISSFITIFSPKLLILIIWYISWWIWWIGMEGSKLKSNNSSNWPKDKKATFSTHCSLFKIWKSVSGDCSGYSVAYKWPNFLTLKTIGISISWGEYNLAKLAKFTHYAPVFDRTEQYYFKLPK